MPNKVTTSTYRWLASRKAQLLARIDAGEISEADALREYALSRHELAHWRRLFAREGMWGLREKAIPMRRHPRSPPDGVNGAGW